MSIGYGAIRGLRNLCLSLLLGVGAAQAETVTLAALGDSLTAGYGLAPDQGFVPQLQAWLDEHGADVRVVNAGVSGDTTAGGLSRVTWTLTPDVDAMIVALGANDYLRAMDPSVTRENLQGILDAGQAAEVGILLVGMEVGSNYGPEYKEKFDQIYPELAAQNELSLFPDWFTGLRAAVNDQSEFIAFMQADGLHPNAAGVALIVEAMGPSILELIEAAE